MKTYKEIFKEAAQAIAMAPEPLPMTKPYCGNCGGPHKTADHASEMSKKQNKKPTPGPTKFHGVYEDE